MLEFFKQELWLIPNWAWFAIVLGVACLLIAIIIIACKRGSKKEDKNEPVLMESEPVKEEKSEPVKEEEVKPAKAEEVKEEPKKTTAKKTADVKEEDKKEQASEKKTTATKTAAKTTAAKTTTASAKSATAKKEETKPAAKEEKSSNETKVYHISKRKEDKKWQVKAEGADKALRLFFTQTDAIEYAKKVAGNQEGRIVIHKEGGGFRKLNY